VVMICRLNFFLDYIKSRSAQVAVYFNSDKKYIFSNSGGSNNNKQICNSVTTVRPNLSVYSLFCFSDFTDEKAERFM